MADPANEVLVDGFGGSLGLKANCELKPAFTEIAGQVTGIGSSTTRRG